MKNFKEIAEKCLAGELSGIFKLASGQLMSSNNLKRIKHTDPSYAHQYEMYVDGHLFSYTIYGTLYSSHISSSLDIIDFIPDNMKKQIKINVPEGKVPVMDQTESGIVITWKEKELTYTELSDKFKHNSEYIHSSSINVTSRTFFKKVEILRKLTNIRNYFGKPDKNEQGWIIVQEGVLKTLNAFKYNNNNIVFAKKEHAEQAIKMLGDELKYLFEPW